MNFSLTKKKIIGIIILAVLSPFVYLGLGIVLCHEQNLFCNILYVLFAPGLFIVSEIFPKLLERLDDLIYIVVFVIQIIYVYLLWSLIQPKSIKPSKIKE